MTDLNTAGTATLGASVERARPKWGWFVALGLLFAVFGVITLSYLTVAGTIASVFMIGFAMLVAGFAEIFLAFQAKTWGWTILWILVGLLYLFAGGVTIAQPMMAATTFTLFISAALIATGVMRIVAAFNVPDGRGMLILSGIITVLLGILILMAWPASGLYTLGMFLGADMLVYGVSWISFGMWLRPKS